MLVTPNYCPTAAFGRQLLLGSWVSADDATHNQVIKAAMFFITYLLLPGGLQRTNNMRRYRAHSPISKRYMYTPLATARPC